MHRHAWFLVALLALAALVRPVAARSDVRASGSAIVATHATARAFAVRTTEPERAQRGTTRVDPLLALPPLAPLSVAPPPSWRLTRDPETAPRPFEPSPPTAAARGPPPSA